MAQTNPISDFLGTVGRGLWSLIVPKTSRGRVRQAVAVVLLLLFFAGNLSQPKYWDRTVDWMEERTGVTVPHFWNLPFRLGLDLQGGTHLVYTADVTDVPPAEQGEAINGVRDVIERRVNAFGVSEPLVQTNRSGDDWRVTVDLAGVRDISEAIMMIGETPILEFKEQGISEPVRDMTAEEAADMKTSNAAALERAKGILDDIRRNGAEFSAQEGVENLGWVSAGDAGTGPLAERIEKIGAVPNAVVPEVTETDDGYNVYLYSENRERGAEYRASHILICWQGASRCESARTQDEARALIDNLKSRATAGNFSSLAKQNSDDAGSASEGGDLGWFGPGAMVPAFESAVAAMEKGDISEVIESEFGYHLIRKVDQRSVVEYDIRRILQEKRVPADYLPEPDPWKNTPLSGKHIVKSRLEFAQIGEPQVGLEFNDEGKGLFADITSRNVGKPVAIFLDGEPISTPTVQERIIDGNAVISGDFSIVEAKQLVRRLNAGALPVPIVLESQQSIGASLGRDSLDRSLYAAMIGFLILIVFMVMYYRLPGLIAVLALGVYTAINLSLYKIIPVTLTLSGIAGFILSVGMAVDANILIFERTKEELLRGRGLQSAVEEGFRRAWPSIRDSNLTTILSCTILYFTSSSLIKGFALTLAIGVLVSMFSAITVSRTLLRLVTGWRIMRSPSAYMPGLNRMPKSE
ncbi:protein translocase subunit SecD [Candidatus Uhrbacteria bacterium]|nr:protein translocase subunit SecD [Candidatus Uhrbacteria bacterium]